MYSQQTTVTWSSSSQGSTIQKTGVVLRFLPANSLPIELEPGLAQLKSSQLKFNPSESSKNDRYLVKVTLLNKRGTKDVYYAPRASAVTEQ